MKKPENLEFGELREDGKNTLKLLSIMKKVNQHLFWIYGPRIIALCVLAISFFSKIMNPAYIFRFLYAFDLPIYFPEMFFSIFLVIEILLICILLFETNTGLIVSVFGFFTMSILIGVLSMVGMRESCTYELNFLTDNLGFAKMIQNIGLALLLFSSWKLKKIDKN